MSRESMNLQLQEIFKHSRSFVKNVKPYQMISNPQFDRENSLKRLAENKQVYTYNMIHCSGNKCGWASDFNIKKSLKFDFCLGIYFPKCKRGDTVTIHAYDKTMNFIITDLDKFYMPLLDKLWYQFAGVYTLRMLVNNLPCEDFWILGLHLQMPMRRYLAQGRFEHRIGSNCIRYFQQCIQFGTNLNHECGENDYLANYWATVIQKAWKNYKNNTSLSYIKKKYQKLEKIIEEQKKELEVIKMNISEMKGKDKSKEWIIL